VTPLPPPEAGGPTVRLVVLAHVSDLHMGAHDRDAAAALVDDVVRAAPAATVVTGDSTMRAQRREFAQARMLIERLPGPRLVVIGNHDLPLRNPLARLRAPYEGFRAALSERLDPVLELPGARVLGLGSMPWWRWKSGRVSPRQADLVVEALGPTPPGTLRVLVLHHPPFARGTARLVGHRRLVRTVVAARVDLVLAGHVHVPQVRRVRLRDRGRSHELVEVVAGTAVSTRVRRRVGRSWSLIRVEPRMVTVQERRHGPGGWRAGRTVRVRLG
jgi:3',5'-cyclic AMP phosphodiesterase CpdA